MIHLFTDRIIGPTAINTEKNNYTILPRYKILPYSKQSYTKEFL